ncbi:uncharacterized protein [Aegilops tauschii subsp. strangulata]|uniref:uncharacterized protein n=1 Tax=Aegilops tauschii subsp. strangulata TaxID=200361 RepID=UPI003CC87708
MRFLRADERDLPWMCIGDFNEVLRREEHLGPSDRAWTQIQQFREVVDACGLADIGYVGMDWTFEKKVTGGQYCRVRLDRALASNEWCNMFPFATLRHLTAIKSDHSPILLMNELEANNRRVAIARPFRYEVMWERHEEFSRVLQQAWSSRPKSSSVAELRQKLDVVAAAFTSWSVQSFGSVRKELRELKGHLEAMRADPCRTGPMHAELKNQERIAELNYREEILWRQRSRIQWLMEGDNNTAFFHRKASARRRKNRVDKLTRANGTSFGGDESAA